MNDDAQLVGGFFAGMLMLPVLALLVRAFRVEVEDGQAVLLTRFGRLYATLTRPGWHWVPERVFPWLATHTVSLRRDFRAIPDIHVNDASGTTVLVDVWVEFRITDPARALFAVEDWDASLGNVVTHAVIAILSNRDFKQILCDRTELDSIMQKEIATDTERWGIRIEQVFIRNVSLLPEVSQQVLHSVAARLERAMADIEEDGRQRVALLHAQTSAHEAQLVAQAKGQYARAVGRALERLGKRPAVQRAYTELYDLSLLHPQRTVSFRGFGDLRAADAAMLEAVGHAPASNGQDHKVRVA
jgi:regulator of protease activity HflC (stomatin/prohibitin superfamily)